MQDVWLECSKKLQKRTTDEGDFWALFKGMMARLDEGELQLFAIVARQIWLCRNDVVFGSGLLNQAMVVRNARA